MGLAVSWDAQYDFRTWRAEQAPGLWEALLEADRILGYNILAFDLPIVYTEALRQARPSAGTSRVPAHPSTMRGTVFDLFDLIRRMTGRWYPLQTLVLENL